MVRLEQVNKYFNKRKKNEIHVINNTTLEMGKAGLVALLGPSGCGKTTLLNAIGGLDKVNSGSIYVNGEKITGRSSGAIDKIRTLNIGYIFQNYNLVENMSVFDNVALALRMTGVKDEDVIREKVEYVLEMVGMYRYRNRHADMLSGGERQRVGIARAIVKDPAIIIADEPTGNLDSRNTIEVMNIIRSISQEKLVILVTHEEELANFYASRIIRIKDGTIESDVSNIHDENLDYRVENKVYLKDLKDHKRIRKDYLDIDFYNDGDTPIHLDIAVSNGNIYIQAKNSEDRIEIVNDNSNIELVDDHYRELTREDTLDIGFDPSMLQYSGQRKYTSIINPLRTITRGFRTVLNYSVLKKILLIGFMLSAMFITYSVGNIFGVMNVTDDEFIRVDESYLTVVSKNIKVDQYLDFENDDRFDYVMPGDSRVSLTLQFDDYFQLQNYNVPLSGSLSSAEKLKSSDIKYGRLPENDKEIVIDEMVLNSSIDDYYTKMAGLGDPADFVGQVIQVDYLGEFEIVGVSACTSPCIYTDPDIFINLLYYAPADEEEAMYGLDSENEQEDSDVLIPYKLKKKDLELKKGSWPENKYEVVVSEGYKDEMPLNKEISRKVNGQKLKVVGYYKDKTGSGDMLVNDTTIKYDLLTEKSNITLCPVDKEMTFEELKEEDINVKDAYSDSKEEYKKELWSYVRSSIILAFVVLAISFIEIFLIMRASFLSRVKEVGVYRAIGVKKFDIYKMFMGEILAITTLASVPGFAFMAYILHKLSQMSVFEDMYLVNPVMLIICLVLLYGSNLLFGLIPVFRTMRKRPAAILSRTDVN